MHSRRNSFLLQETTFLIGISALLFIYFSSCFAATINILNSPVVINNGAQFTNSPNITLTLNISAVFPSASNPEMSINNTDNSAWTNWEPYNKTKTWTLTPGDGVKTVEVRFRSVTYNVQVNPPAPIYQTSTILPASITLDTTPPELAITNPSTNGTQIISQNLEVRWTATDSGSGLGYIEALDQNGNYINLATNMSYPIDGLANGTYTFGVKAFDNVGNAATAAVTFIVGVPSSPTTSATPSPPITSPPVTSPTSTSSSTQSTPGLPLPPWFPIVLFGVVGGLVAAGVVVVVVRYFNRPPTNALDRDTGKDDDPKKRDQVLKSLTATSYKGDPRVYYLAADLNVHELASTLEGWVHRIISTDAGAPQAIAGSPLISDDGYFGINVDLFYLDTNNHVHGLSLEPDGWHHKDISSQTDAPLPSVGSTLTATIKGGISGLSYSSIERRIYYLDTYLCVRELAWWGLGWHQRNVSTDGGGVPAIAQSALASTRYEDNPRVYYLAADLNIHELAWFVEKDAGKSVAASLGTGIPMAISGDGSWHHRNVSSDSHGPPAMPLRALIASNVGFKPKVYYLDLLFSLHELSWSGNSWHNRCLSLDTSAPMAFPTSTITSTSTSTGAPNSQTYYSRVFYLGIDLHVHDLALSSGTFAESPVTHRDASQIAMAPPATVGSALVSTSYKGEPRVYYFADDYHIHELAWWGGSWHHKDIFAESQAPPANP